MSAATGSERAGSPESAGTPKSPQSAEGPGSRARARAAFPFVPRVRLFGERMLVEEGEGEHEVNAAVLSLEFDYEGVRIRPADEAEEIVGIERNFAAEARAQRILESFGAVELSCLTGCTPDFDSQADYLVSLEDNAHTGCSFVAYAVRELEAQGFEVTIDRSYPFQVLPAEAPWYAEVAPDDELDWFGIELGIEVDGVQINLVPALLEVLESTAEGTSFGALAHCPSRFRAIPVGSGKYAVLPWERLSRVLRVLADLYPEGGKNTEQLELPVARVMDLAELDDALTSDGGNVSWRGEVDWVERAKALQRGPEWSPQPAALKATLRPYQHEGLMWLEHLRDAGVGGVLADDMGLGKTLQTISLLAREKEARRMEIPTLIVTPTSLVGNWQRELEKFAPHIRVLAFTGTRRHKLWGQLDRAEVVITSYPILLRDLERLSERTYHYVILDEAQAIKNPRSQASIAVRSLQSRHRLALSGTPVENNLTELWSLFEFTMPGLLGRPEQFRKRYRDPIERCGDEETLVALRNRVTPFILRRLKESVARDLPPKTELVRAVELEGDQRDLYESIRVAAHGEVRHTIAQKGIAGSAVTILDALTKLRQVCCDPRLVPVPSAREVQRSAKYALFFELLCAQLAEGRRVLVFSQFARMLGLLSQGMRERDIEHVTLTGSTPDRQKVVDAFEGGEADVFLISLKAGGTGLNLVSADTVIHYDPWWNAAAQMQATDRAYRIGQKRPVFVYNLIAASSVEERMLALQRRKRYLADTLLGTPGSGQLSLEDVEDLFAPLEDE
ncbi:MAG: DEAD/DEAH box helicase [Myxococcales bacterium]|nr:DEAD/DEAH box helicase [Myxococcales bacterium]